VIFKIFNLQNHKISDLAFSAYHLIHYSI